MHRLARTIVAIAVVLLAVVAAPRLALDYAPRPSSSEVVVSLVFPAAASGDPVDVTTRYIVPIEGAIRSLGDVIATRGEAGADGADLTVRFRRGIDAELKAARLTSELASLRAGLPEGSRLEVSPTTDSGTQPSAIFALTSSDAARTAERLADELRAVPGVRKVTTFGATRDEIDVRTFGDAPVNFADRIRRALAPSRIGRAPLGQRNVGVIAATGATRLRDVRIDGQRLDAIATIREHRAEPRMVARLNGREAVVLSVVRDDDTSLFAFDNAVRAALRGRGTTKLRSDAAELRVLLVRTGLGALLATIALTFAAGRRPRLELAGYIPLAFAVMINICRIFALRVDALAILAACIAIAGLAPIAIWIAASNPPVSHHELDRPPARRTSSRWPLAAALLFAALPLTATALAGSALASALAAPARMFALGALSAVCAALLLPPVVPAAGSGRLERRLLRASAAIVLAAVAVATFLLSWFGDRLDPRYGTRTPERDHLYIDLALPAGTTLAPTVLTLARAEQALARVSDALPRFWSSAGPGRARIVADVAPAFQRADRLELLKSRIAAVLPLPPGVARISEAYDRSNARLDNDLEERPFADENGGRYRVLLKGTEASALRRAFDSIATRLAGQNISRSAIVAAWPEAATRITLVPRRGLDPAKAEQLARALAERTTPPPARTLPDGRILVATGADTPRDFNDVPRAEDLFARALPMTVAAAFDVRHEPVSGRVTRELGRFVLPVDITLSGATIEQKRDARVKADRTLSLMTLPPGVVMERPPLARWTFSGEKLRLLGLAVLLPSMMFALAAIVLSSLRRALVALAPAVVAIACTSPLLLAAGAPMDELVLLAIGASLCCVSALSTTATLHFTRIASTYRAMRRSFVGCTIAAAAGAVMTGVAATGGGELGETWRAPLLAACVVFAAGGAAALLLPAAIESLLRRRAAAVVTPIEDRAVRLEVQNVTKIYGSGFRALHRVSFDLEPGIVGLLGPNGAGKTTLLRIVTGLLLPTRGVVRFGGVEVRPSTLAEYRLQIGFLPQEFNAYAGLTAAQFLDYWALERGIAVGRLRDAEVGRLLAIARLEAHADRKLRDFSGGMRRRIGIARAMIGDPPLLVVDEPTTGLDIEARAHFRELITTLARDRIIILSTHIASDVESTASRLLLLSGGKLCWDGPPDALVARARGRVFEMIVDESDTRELARRYRITTRVRLAAGVRVRGIVAVDEPLPGATVEPSLEEAYLAEIAPRLGTRTASFAFVYETE